MSEPLSRDRIDLLLSIVKSATDIQLQVTRFCPGDGWARYSMQVVNGPDSSYELVNSLNAKEMVQYLEGMYALARLKRMGGLR